METQSRTYPDLIVTLSSQAKESDPASGLPRHSHDLPHAIRQREDEFRARKATKDRGKIRHADRRSTLRTRCGKLLVRDVLHTRKSCYREMLRSQVLPIPSFPTTPFEIASLSSSMSSRKPESLLDAYQ